MTRPLILALTGAIAIWFSAPTPSRAQAHFAPGLANIRDYAEPDPGLYLAVYNYSYITSDLKDNDGNKVTQIVLGPNGGLNLPLNVNVDVKLYALAPTFIWVTGWDLLGAHYGAYIAPSFSNSNISAGLSTVNGQGTNPQTSQFSAGDLFVQPIWLGWNRKLVDAAIGYGFYAPVGKYDYRALNFPVIGSRVVTAPTNVGLGYWTNQIQGNVTWYPNPNRGLAITNTITGEFNGKQRGTGLTNGDFLTWNWGGSLDIPLEKTQPRHLIEAGLTGYSQWQLTDMTGPDVENPNEHEHVHGIGTQVGFISIPKNIQLSFRYIHEFSAANRFQGDSYSLNFSYVIKAFKSAPPPPQP